MKTAKYANGLREAMSSARIGSTELADLVGTSKQNITRWSKGDRKLTVDWATKIAPHLRTTAAVLLQVQEKEPLRQLRMKHARGVEVPLISWVSAGRLLKQDGVRSVDVERYVVADLKAQGDWIALEVTGDSMDLVARDGAIIFVDRKDQRLRDEGFYVFTLDDGSTTFKRYRGGSPPRLQPFSRNPDHETAMATEGMRVVGRVRRTVLDL